MPKPKNTKKMTKSTTEPPPSPPRKARHTKPDPNTTATSSAAAATHTTSSPVFFWKEDEANGFLCQWYRCTFTDPLLPGPTFTCAEQYMMYKKALLSDDSASAAKILAATSARKQKALGREVANYDETRWCEEWVAIVERASWLKVSQGTNAASMRMGDAGEPVALKGLLLATKGRELVEASPFDRVWGIGFKAEEALGVSRARWGENLLGKALMRVRDQLEREEEVGSGESG